MVRWNRTLSDSIDSTHTVYNLSLIILQLLYLRSTDKELVLLVLLFGVFCSLLLGGTVRDRDKDLNE